ncbi:hypothetical protein PISMIDRAFT_172788 [Pisolithus microcarpus 441]|uniref:Uncharacterized protein n=1 Tax=Pisolithus microcarpus 441 TaxID=765257 RepID=A0A0C9Z8Y0_9AGAM|nr:hypothetical protein PISMIDRAFT_172788 [Pisolithus microcarpus 441]
MPVNASSQANGIAVRCPKGHEVPGARRAWKTLVVRDSGHDYGAVNVMVHILLHKTGSTYEYEATPSWDTDIS